MPLPKGPKVVVGFHDWGLVTSKFTLSLAMALGYEGRRVTGILQITSPYVTEARNRIVHQFLRSYDAKWLLMMDCDLEFPEDAISTCIYLAEAHNIPVLAGDYALGNFGHSLFAKAEGSTLCSPVADIAPNMIYRDIYAAGTGWLFIRRDVLEKLRELHRGPWHWFDHDPHALPQDLLDKIATGFKPILEAGKGEFNEGGIIRMGEDLSFCARVAQAGFEIAGLTGLRLVHHKTKGIVSEELKDMYTGVENIIAVANPFAPKKETSSGTDGADLAVAAGQEAGGGAVHNAGGFS